MAISLLPAVHAGSAPAISNNINDHFYINVQRWTDPIRSTLAYEAGGFLRAEAIGSDLVVERYDADFGFLSGREIPLELPVYGGVYICDDYNFVVVGQENFDEDDNKEVFRIIRYTKDWQNPPVIIMIPVSVSVASSSLPAAEAGYRPLLPDLDRGQRAEVLLP